MLNTPQIRDWPGRLLAVLPMKIPRSEIMQAMGPGIQELMSTVMTQGIAPCGPLLTHHFQRPGEIFDFEIAVPVLQSITPAGRVQPGQQPALKVAQVVYQGPYEGLGQAWGEFEAWLQSSGQQGAVDLWETYLVGPESGLPGSEWKTELTRPLIG